jgi:hypothetical protein
MAHMCFSLTSYTVIFFTIHTHTCISHKSSTGCYILMDAISNHDSTAGGITTYAVTKEIELEDWEENKSNVIYKNPLYQATGENIDRRVKPLSNFKNNGEAIRQSTWAPVTSIFVGRKCSMKFTIFLFSISICASTCFLFFAYDNLIVPTKWPLGFLTLVIMFSQISAQIVNTYAENKDVHQRSIIDKKILFIPFGFTMILLAICLATNIQLHYSRTHSNN